jgi:hypothetical protein
VIAAEKSEVRFGNTRIPYSIRRSRRRETVSIAVDPRAGVLLTVPADTPIEKLDRLVHRKATWIRNKLRHVDVQEQPIPPREFVSGETFRYLGRQYRLRVRQGGADAEGVRLLGGHLVVAVPRGLGQRERADRVRLSLVEWYRTRAAQRLPERVAHWYAKVRAPEPKVFIRDQQKRWASCDQRGNVRFNWRIIQAPMSLIDYVVVHELAHLKRDAHDKAFWATVGRVLPKYERHREALRRMGAILEW